MHECQKKGLAKRAIRKRMKIKSLFFMRKRGAIHKCMKRKNGDSGGYRGVNPKMGIVDRHPAVFVRAERGRSAKILIGTSRLSVNKHAKGWQEIGDWLSHLQGIERIGSRTATEAGLTVPVETTC